jgi:penicillin-binding protein 1A
MDEAMHETVIKGTATQILAPELPEARGKTGTTQLAKDAWFCGYVDGVLGIGWVGNMQKSGGRWTQQRMADSVFGGTVTTIIWRDIMKEARKLHGSRIVPPAPDWVAAAPPEPKREEVVVEPPVTEPVPPVEEETVPEPPKEELPIAVDPSQFPGEGLDPSDPNASTPGLTPANPPTSTPEGERVPPPDERRRDRAIERERDRQAADARGQGAEMTTVEICVDSGRVATMYCPETVARKFPRGSVPSRRCRIHGTDD